MCVHHSGHKDVGTAIEDLGTGLFRNEFGFRSNVGYAILGY